MEGKEHTADFYDFGGEVCVLVFGQIAEVLGQQQLVLDLAGRTCGDVDETGKLVVGATSAAFGHVGRDRRTRPP